MSNSMGNLQHLLLKNEFQSFVAKYLCGEGETNGGIQSKYLLFSEKLEAKRFVLPVTGVQGCGKSTLLNALAFDYPVLPVDVDETTCVPVEIVWAAKPDGKATVIFQDGHVEKIKANEKNLNRFVHNDFNPGNKLLVDRIILKSKLEPLKHGMVLVDLPGTGSLTAANMETTKKFLEEAVGIFFLLRTVPPITQSQSIFVTFQWARFPTAIFVQNRWTDETKREVEEARKHNVKVLESIAKRNRISLDDSPDITVVNAYVALDGSLSKNIEKTNQSGLSILINKLTRISQDWTNVLLKGIVDNVENDILSVKDQVQIELELLDMSASEAEESLQQEQIRFDEYIGKVKEKRISSIDKSDDFTRSTRKQIDTWSTNSKASLRNNMRTKMRAGIVDGPRLERALQDEESSLFDDLYEDIIERVLTFQDEIKEKFAGIDNWDIRRTESFHTVSKEEKRKIENLLPRLVGIVGAAGAGAGAAAAAGAGAAALVTAGTIGATMGSVIPVIGTVIGAGIGMFIGAWLGKKSKNAFTRVRADRVEKEVFEAIRKFVSETSATMKEQIVKINDDLSENILLWEQTQIEKFKNNRSSFHDLIRTDGDKRKQLMNQLTSDLSKADAYIRELEGISK